MVDNNADKFTGSNPADAQNQSAPDAGSQQSQKLNPIANKIKLLQYDKQMDLSSTNTEFLQYTPKYAADVKAKNMDYNLLYIILGIMLIAPVIDFISILYAQHYSSYTYPAIDNFSTLTTLMIEFFIAGIISIYIGFKKFSLEQILSSTPVIKIDVATYNLNKMQGKFTPYKNQPLKAPISGAECVYYAVNIYATFQKGKPVVLGTVDNGVPTLFTDGSGYLAIDMIKARNVETFFNEFIIYKEGLSGILNLTLATFTSEGFKEGKQLAAELLPQIIEATKNNKTVNLSQIPGFKFTQHFNNCVVDLKAGVPIHSDQNFAYFLVENYIPINSDYTCLGGAADSNKSIEDKPVKILTPDQSRGIMAVKAEATQNIAKSMNKTSTLNFIFGVLFIIAALYILSVVLRIPSTTPTNVNNTIATTIPITTASTSPQSQPPKTLIANSSCSNLFVSEPTWDTKESSICSWSGGNVKILAGGGISGYVSVEIIGSDGKTYFNNSTTNWCPAQIGNVYLPPQNYSIIIFSGKGGGNCNSNPNATVLLSPN